MEGGGGGGFGFMNLPKKPPFTAINKFLWGNNHHFSKQSLNKKGFCEFCCCSFGSNRGYECGVSCPRLIETNGSVGSNMFFEREYDKWVGDQNFNSGFKEGMRSSGVNSKEKVKNEGGRCCSNGLIKGQWSEEEDILLMKLVKQYGQRKWAQIAEKMVGRAGKQCRERWHNHLRPDIKKDVWSEEEERMLVEAHEVIGNKWAEISKKIPGRTENSIKNHWNATKRRQNSRRKGKKQGGQNGNIVKSTLLQDYIRSLENTSSSTTTTITKTTGILPTAAAATTNSSGTTTNSTISEDPSIKVDVFSSDSAVDDHHCNSFIAHTYDDELSFMQSFFGENTEIFDKGKTVISYDQVGTEGTLDWSPYQNMNSSNFPNFEENSKNTHLNSDLYLSYLLDGKTILPSNENSSHGNVEVHDLLMSTSTAQLSSSSGGNKEMDLIEMVSSSHFLSPWN